jgi:hypothetical protein
MILNIYYIRKLSCSHECIILHNNFGWGEGRCSQFIGSWKGLARRLRKIPTEKEQADFIAPQIEKIFKNGYPNDFIENL